MNRYEASLGSPCDYVEKAQQGMTIIVGEEMSSTSSPMARAAFFGDRGFWEKARHAIGLTSPPGQPSIRKQSKSSSLMPEQVRLGREGAAIITSARWARWELVALLLTVVIFFALASHQINAPGLYYDEMLVISPATGTPAYKTWFGVPILISPYVGAEKSWIYPPIFALFGVSAWTIRLPAILMSCGTLIFGYGLMRRILTPGWALIFSAACAVHPGFIFLTKLDWGPHVLMLFLKAVTLVVWFRWLDGAQKSCWFLLGLWLLGFWDKFNFIWFVIALVVATCVIYGAVVLRKIRKVRRALLLTTAIGLLLAGSLVLWIILPLLQKPAAAALPDRLLHIWTLYKYTCTGKATAQMWFKSVPPLPSWTGWCVPALSIFFLVLALVGYAERKTRGNKVDQRTLRFCLWCLLMFGIIFLEIALTPQAGGAHHTIMLFPFDLLACFSAAYLCVHALSGKTRVLVLVLEGCVLCVWGLSNLESLEIQFSKFKEIDSFRARFSPRIELLGDYLNAEGSKLDAIHCVDWGIGMQLAAICRPEVRRKVIDEWMTFRNWSTQRSDAKATAEQIFSPQSKAIYLSFTAQEPVFPETRRNFAEMNTLAGTTLQPVGFVPAELGKTYQAFSNCSLSSNRPK